MSARRSCFFCGSESGFTGFAVGVDGLSSTGVDICSEHIPHLVGAHGAVIYGKDGASGDPVLRPGDCISVVESPLVVIDPGHGGKKPGAVSPHDGTLEKDLNLQVSQILGGKLSELGLATQYTRFEDTHIKLADRADIANTQKANLLLSVHFNSSERGAPTGMEIFRNLEGVDFSVSLGKDLCKWGDHVGLAFRGVKNGDHLKVLRLCERPSVLLECGFMNSRNNSDVETVMREVESFTDAVANSVAAYLQGES